MRPDKFTQKMQEAPQAAQDSAAQFNQQEITNGNNRYADRVNAAP
jgi:hypothetical protein